MANYGSFYPSPYSPYGFNNGYGIPQTVSPQPMMQNTQQMQQPIQPQTPSQQMPHPFNSGFVHVQSEMEARQHPVAPGNSVTFIDDNQSFCYTKSMSFNQLDPPQFRKFKLVEVTEQHIVSDEGNTTQPEPNTYALKADLEAVRAELESLESKFENIAPKSRPKSTKEAEKNEQST